MTLCSNCKFCQKETDDKFNTELHFCKMPTTMNFVTGIQNYTTVNCYSKNTEGKCPDYYVQMSGQWDR